MKLRLSEIAQQAIPPKMVIQSFEGSLYRVVARIDKDEFVMVDGHDEPLQASHPTPLKEKLSDYPIDSIELEHCSAYDEMIGHPQVAEDEYKTPLGELPCPEHHKFE